MGILPPVAALCLALCSRAAEEPPLEWIEPATGHRVVRLSREPGSSSLYFHQNAYTPEGDKLLITTPQGLTTVNLKTRALDLVVRRSRYGIGGSSGIEMGRKTRQVYYSQRDGRETIVFATQVDTKVTRQVGRLPFAASFGGVNADETFIVGAVTSREPNGSDRSSSDGAPQDQSTGGDRPQRRTNRFTGNGISRSMRLFALNTTNGQVTTFHPSTNWLNHVQCSPTDPSLVLFCHEGEWHNLDRIWTIRIGSDQPRLMHRRTMPYEIAGHEFFSHDGQWIWYDLQTPRSKEFWLAGVNVRTVERIRYPIERNQWSVHYNISRDGRLFAGDGGGPNSVANTTPLPERRKLDPPGNGQWIYLFTPQPGDSKTTTIAGENVTIGKIAVEKLVDLSAHDYRLEPNVTFTPDGRWIVFRSNMHGATHTYAVDIAKGK